MTEKLSFVRVYLMSHRDVVQAEYVPLAQLEMGMLPTKGDMIDIRDYVFNNVRGFFDRNENVLRVDALYILYDRESGKEVVTICGTAIPRPEFL